MADTIDPQWDSRTWKGWRYTDSASGISFEPPEGWRVEENERNDEDEYNIRLVGTPTDGSMPELLLFVTARDGASLDHSDKKCHIFPLDVSELVAEGRMSKVNGLTSCVADGKSPSNVYRWITLEGNDNFYTFVYINDKFISKKDVEILQEIVNSVEVKDVPPQEVESGGCLIATAAHGTELAPQVQRLREVRDGALLSTGTGTAFMGAFSSVYYSFSPAVADLERQSPEFRAATAALAAPMLYSMSLMSLAGEGSEASVVALGAAVVMLNLVMYVAAPAAGVAACVKIRNASK